MNELTVGNRHVAVIPVKAHSERVKNKNFREFADGLSLLEYKIQQVIRQSCYSEIYISSDSDDAEKVAKIYGLSFIRRSKEYCNNVTPWSDVIYEVARSIPEEDNTILSWCHTTSPLFERYKAARDCFDSLDSDIYDGVVSVCPFSEFLITAKARPYNYSWGPWHPYSQDLDKLFTITGALFMTSKGVMLKNRYVISRRPYLFESSKYESIDVDTNYDFRVAQLLKEYGNELADA